MKTAGLLQKNLIPNSLLCGFPCYSSSLFGGGKREREDGDDGNSYRALSVCESSWRKIPISTMSLSQNINFHDKALLPGRMSKASTLT